MIRKAIKSNHSTLVVSLPIKWVKKHKVSKGAEFSVIENESGDLIISTKTQNHTKKKELKLQRSDPEYIEGQIRQAYITGYDELTIYFEDDSAIIPITNYLPLCMGYEMIEQKKSYCIVRNVMLERKEEYNIFFRKLLQASLYLSEVVAIHFSQKPMKETDLKIESLYKTVTKYTNYCRRVGYKFHLIETEKGILEYTLATLFHMIAGNYRYAYSYFLHHPAKLGKSTLEYIEKVNAVYRLLGSMYETGKLDKNLHKSIGLLMDEGNKLVGMKKANPAITKYFSEIARILRASASKVQAIANE